MANSDKNILITPNIGQAAQPSIVFTGQGNDPISLRVLDETVGAISFEGSAGQLFGITDNLTSGSIFSVNDVSGIPIIDVQANGTLTLGTTGTNIGIGTTSPVSPFEVQQNTTSTVDFTLTNSNTGANITKGSRIRFRITDSAGTRKDVAYITALPYNSDSSTGDHLSFWTRTADATPTEKVRITNTGNVGIGYTNPTDTLQVSGTIFSSSDMSLGGELNFHTPTTKFVDFYTKDAALTTYAASMRLVNHDSTSFHSAVRMLRDGAVELYHNNVKRLETTAGGVTVGNAALGASIGNTLTIADFIHSNTNISYVRIRAQRNTTTQDWTGASTKILHITDVTEQGYIEFNPNAAQAGMAFGQSTTEFARFLSDGKFGIGITPTEKLHVSGNSIITGNLTVSGGTITAGNVATALLGGNTTTNISLGAGLTTGTLTLGSATGSGTIAIGNTGTAAAQAVNIATATTGTITIGGTGSTAVQLPTGKTKVGQTFLLQGGAVNITLPSSAGTLYASGNTDVALADGGTNASLTAVNGGVVYSSASALAISAAGTSGQLLVSKGAAAPAFESFNLFSHAPDSSYKSVCQVATTADLGASTFASNVLTGYDDTFTLACTTTAGSAIVTTTSTIGIKVGAVVSGNANIPASRTVASIDSATQFTLNSGTSVLAATSITTTFTQTITALSIDGVTLALNDRVLVKDQLTLGGLNVLDAAKYNGIYTVTATGSGTVPWTLTRATDADSATDLDGAIVNISVGTANYGKSYKTRFKGTDTINTTEMYWGRVTDVNSSSYIAAPANATAIDLSTDTETIRLKTGNITDLVTGLSIGVKTINSFAASTYARASSVYIAGAPVQGPSNATITTAEALTVASGASSFNGIVKIEEVPSATTGQLFIVGRSGAVQREGKLRFGATFHTSADTTARLTASIRSGFSASAWGNEYLDFFLNNTNNDSYSDANQGLVMRMAYGGNVGIGTTNPAVKFDVVGVGQFTANGATLNLVGTDHSYIQWYPNGIAAGRKAYMGYSGAAVNYFAIENQIAGSVGHIVLQPGGGGAAAVLVNTTTATGTVGQSLQVTGGAYVSGNVGIGATNPLVKLEVVGDVRANNLLPSFQVLNLDAIKSPGLYQYDGAFTGTKPPDNAANYRTVEIGNATRFSQIAMPWDSSFLFYRRQTDGIWSSWSTVAALQNSNTWSANQTFSAQIISTRANDATTGGGQIYLNGATGNRIDFNNAGIAVPSLTTRSAGTKIILNPSGNIATEVDFAFGISSLTLWSSVPDSTRQFRWYAGTTNIATLFGTGQLVLGTTTLTGTASQPLQVTGGAYVSGNVGIGRTAPLEKFEVAGPIVTFGITGNNQTSAASFDYYSVTGGARLISWGASGVNGTISFWTGSGGATSNQRLTIDVTGNVGIGITNPTNKLDVAGVGAFVNNGNQLLLHTGTNVPTIILRNDGSDYYHLISAAGTTPSGVSNTLRPFTINLATGSIAIENIGNPNFRVTNQAPSTSTWLIRANTIGIANDAGIFQDASNNMQFAARDGSGTLRMVLNSNNTSGSYINTTAGFSIGKNTTTPGYTDLGTNLRVGITTQAATYSNAAGGTTITVTATNHGMTSGDSVWIDFTAGTLSALDAYFNTVTVTNSNTFTVTYPSAIAAANTAQACTLYTESQLRFPGAFGDGSNSYDHSIISERLWGGADKSELLIFKGNDSGTTIQDNIRLAAAGDIFFHTGWASVGTTYSSYIAAHGNTTASSTLSILASGGVCVNTGAGFSVGKTTVTPGYTDLGTNLRIGGGAKAGTYTNTAASTTITITCANHGIGVFNSVYIDFTGGTVIDAYFGVVQSTTQNTFTVTYPSAIPAANTNISCVVYTENQIRFPGQANDTSGNFDTTMIAERSWGAFDKSELLIFKGGESGTSATQDNIRLAASGDIYFHTGFAGAGTTLYNGYTQSFGDTINSSTVSILSNGNVGIGTTNPTTNLHAWGYVTNGGTDFVLGNSDQVTRGNSGSSRALVKDSSATLVVNFNGDFGGGTRIDGPLLIAPAAITRNVTNSNLTLNGGTNATVGANIELYGSTHASQPNNAFYDGTTHTIRSVDGVTTFATINSSGLSPNALLIPYTEGAGTALTATAETTNQVLFPAAGDTITLGLGVYEISMILRVTRGSGSTTASALKVNLLGTGGAGGTFTGIATSSIIGDGGATSTFYFTGVNVNTNNTVTTTSTTAGGVYIAQISGILKVTTAGTIIPAYGLTVNLAGAGTTTTCNATNYMRLLKISTSGTTTAQGGWG
jgi:hypothetical protein